MKTIRNHIKFSPLVLVVVFLAGCTVPNVQPFAEATATMGRGLREVGKSTSGVLKAVPINKHGTLERMKLNDEGHPSHTFLATWAEHLRAVEAMETYSATLAEVANTNKNSKKNAEALVKPFVDLVDKFPSLSLPASEIGSLITQMKATTDEIVTYHTLSKQVKAAHPLFVQMIPLMQKALGSALLMTESSSMTSLMDYEASKNDLTTRWNNLNNKLKKLEDKYLEVTQNTAAREELAKDISVVSEMIERMEPEYTAFTAKIAGIKSSWQNTLSLFTQTQSAFKKWLESHARLVKALEENHQPNFTVLLTRADEIKIAIEAIQNAN